MPAKFREDPYGGYNFEVVINGVSDDGTAVKGSFAEVSGLEAELTPIEYRGGAEPDTPRKIRGLVKYPNLVLKRGIIGDPALWNWIQEAMDGKVRRTEGAVVLLDENKQEVMRWNFTRGWPCKWTGPGLNAKNNEIGMETLEICHEGLKLDA
jgi:phage tail-like protein